MSEERRPAVAIVRIPMRLGSISGGRFDLAPDAIENAAFEYVAHGRHELSRLVQLGVEIEEGGDVGSIADLRPEAAFDDIRGHIAEALEDEVGRIRDDRAVLVLGGDNSITRPGVHGVSLRNLQRTALLTLDAHHDVRDTANGLSNGNPVRALLEDGLPGGNVVQIGIQSFANMREHAEFARAAGIHVTTADEVRARGIEVVVREALDDLAARADGIYVDLDVDVLDRAFAPACPGARPGGLMPWELQTAARVCGEHPKVRAIDIVEVDPERDVADVTVMAAASFVLAFAAGLAARAR